jgi:hypothetical protein
LGTEAQPYLAALDYVEGHHKTSLGYGFKQDGGNSCGDYTWFEGTSQVALAYLLAGNQGKWQSIIDSVHSVQDASGGVPATDGPCLNTGFTLDDGSPWEYFPRIHVGASGWLSLSENAINPYKGNLYSPQLSTQILSFGVQPIGTNGPSQTVMLSNPGALPLSIQNAAISGTNSQDFKLLNSCGSSLAAGQSCAVTVSFLPKELGPLVASLTIAETSDPAMVAGTFAVALSGTGVPFNACDLQRNGSIGVADVQLIINEALGVITARDDLNGDGVVNVIDIQTEINAVLNLGCQAK